ncbi:TetR/AcrR family transcriptional regulator [Alkalicella caledoniensis]|uniref:TetR/AcrR family transcriptional regulator n=1 Tax=Alkalicella caledoniensis TaxID=2731377 RepID=A0A7G9W9A4_ALKCA|nr:TetR/AcrR family transcriptional regulator [Alkalicella caledoniensis]QNO15266.1 TetR/AcrR family transcriptional regulator [Alkalicella caledoniensis]
MGPKTKFNKQDIVEAAFKIAREKGFSAITARNVAKRLESSVAPIYVNFATIEDLTTAVVERVFALSDEFLAREKGADIFENIGRASLNFARQYPVFVQELILKPNPYMASYEKVEDTILEAIKGEETMIGLTRDEQRRLLLKLRIFQTGLTAFVANGHIPSWIDEDEVEELLFEVGDEFLRALKMKGENKR